MKQFSNISLKDYHTFHTNEIASKLTLLESKEDALEYLNKSSQQKRQVIGEGSNLLFANNFDGELIKIANKGIEVIEEKGNWAWVKVAAGENWDELVEWTVSKGYGGIENLSYIPGTVGAAPVQNIGAYGMEFKEVFNSLEAIHIPSGELQNFYLQELDFDYRYSVFKGPLKNQYLILNVVLKLARYPKINLEYGQLKEEAYKISNKSIPDIKDVRQAVIDIRKSKLPDPDQIGNAGSFFKNPVISESHFIELKKNFPDMVHFNLGNQHIKLAAAWLIDQCGLRGASMGNAGTHEKHALIIINKGQSSGKELKEFSEHIQVRVQEKFGVLLEPEVLIL